MNIGEMIEILTQIKEDYGDMRVKRRGEDGNWYNAYNIAVDLYREPASEEEYVVFID